MRKRADEKLPWRDEPWAWEDLFAGLFVLLLLAVVIYVMSFFLPPHILRQAPSILVGVTATLAGAWAMARRKRRFEERAQRMIEVLVAEAPLEPKDIAARIGSDDVDRVRITAARLARDGVLQRTPDGYRPAA